MHRAGAPGVFASAIRFVLSWRGGSGGARMLLGGGRGREHDPAAGTLRPPRRDPPARPLRPDLPARRLPPHAATASSTLGRRLPSPCCDSDLRPTPTTPLCDGGHSPAPKGRADCRWAEEYTGRRAPSQPEMGGGCRGGSSRELRRSRRWAQRPDWKYLPQELRDRTLVSDPCVRIDSL